MDAANSILVAWTWNNQGIRCILPRTMMSMQTNMYRVNLTFAKFSTNSEGGVTKGSKDNGSYESVNVACIHRTGGVFGESILVSTAVDLAALTITAPQSLFHRIGNKDDRHTEVEDKDAGWWHVEP